MNQPTIGKKDKQKRKSNLHDFLGEDATLVKIPIANSLERPLVLEQAMKFLETHGITGRVATVMIGVLDELVMNAVFDAPVDENKNQKYATTPRTVEIPLQGESSVEVWVGVDEENIGFMVADNFGSLNPDVVVDPILSGLTRRAQQYQVDESVQGAGLGIKMIVNSGGSILFTVKPGERTEVSVLFKKTNSVREFRTQRQFVLSRME